MKITKAKRSKRLFLVLLAGTLFFISVSVALIYKVNVTRAQVENHVLSRNELAVASGKLSEYWTYTYILVLIACGLSILVSVGGFLITRSRNHLVKQKRDNRFLLNNSIDCIIVCDNEGRIQEFNKEAERMFGYRYSEVKNKPASMLYFREDDMKEVNRLLAEKRGFTGEVVNRHKNGQAFTSFLSANALYDEQRRLIGSMGISRNITEQKKREDEFRYIVNNAMDIIYTATLKGEFSYVNPSVKSVLGYTSEELTGRPYQSLVWEEDRERVGRFYTEHFKSRKEESYCEFRVIRKDGSVTWVGQNIKTVFDPVDPKVITGFHGIVRDINDRKTVEFQLADSEKKYRELFDNSSELIQSIAPSGHFLYVNKVWKTTLGYTDEELNRITLKDVIHPESIAYCMEKLREISAMREPGEKRHRYSVRTKDGQKRTLESTVNVRMENGKVVSIQSFARDVTRQEETEKQLTKSEVNFRQIAETINDVFYLYNIIEKKYEYISPNCDEILGADQEFFYSGKSHTAKFAHPEDKIKLREANVLVDAGTPYEIEYRLIINGETRWINEKSFPIRDLLGQVTSNSGICRDVTNIHHARETIYDQSLEIGKSIAYAKTIQDSSLPNTREIKTLFPESFVFYSPKDILSGDFYMFEELRLSNNHPVTAFLVADCTGHGVPGGILSLLCTSLVKESFNVIDPLYPSETLDFVREKIIKFFRSNQVRRTQDGMDIAFCVLDKQKNKLYFAGANESVLIIRDNELLEYAGDKQHVGYNVKQRPFTTHEIDVKSGDCIYLFTDGYSDQFGGTLDKRFTKKRLKKLLLTIHDEPMEQQSRILKHTFYDWQGTAEQTDDVAVVGVRI